MSAAPVIACRQLRRWFGRSPDTVHALRGIDLDVRQGELFMLVGPSGCGKTTLISIMAGILKPSEGSCLVLGEDICSLSPLEQVRFRARNIGFVFQSFNLLPALSAAENVAMPLFIQGYDRQAAIDQAHNTLSLVGLGARGKSLPAQLSGGQQQRVAIARALIHQPEIIVCDEPTSALDHKTGQQVIELMQELTKEHGTTLIVVTHDSRIFDYADRIGEMDDGIITAVRDISAQQEALI